MIEINHPVIAEWCQIMKQMEEGDYRVKGFNIYQSSKIGDCFCESGEKECHYFYIRVSYYKGFNAKRDVAKFVTTYPAPFPVDEKRAL